MGASLRKAGCLCGAVQLSITGEPVVMAYCHCESCRRWLGAPVHASSLWATTQIRIDAGADRLAMFKRTEGTGSHRQFCTSCGSPVLVGHPGIGMTDVPAVAVAGLVFEPTLHTFYGEGVLAMPDGLPKYRDNDPALGGTGERLPE